MGNSFEDGTARGGGQHQTGRRRTSRQRVSIHVAYEHSFNLVQWVSPVMMMLYQQYACAKLLGTFMRVLEVYCTIFTSTPQLSFCGSRQHPRTGVIFILPLFMRQSAVSTIDFVDTQLRKLRDRSIVFSVWHDRHFCGG